jgi:hypothetical protein
VWKDFFVCFGRGGVVLCGRGCGCLMQPQKSGVEDFFPITTIPCHCHHVKLIHLTEGVAKQVVKLMIVTVPPRTRSQDINGRCRISEHRGRE